MHQVRAAYQHKLKKNLRLAKGEHPEDPPPEVEVSDRVTYVDASEGWPALVKKLVDVDIVQLEDDHGCLYMQKYVYPGTVIFGDVRLTGDWSSEDLRHSNSDEDDELHSGYVIILGDLHVDGTLEVVQEHDLFVAGSIHAHSLLSNSANTVVRDRVCIRDLVWQETSEEGGWLWAQSIDAPMVALWVDGEGPGYLPSVSGDLVEVYSEEAGNQDGVLRALTGLSSNPEEAPSKHPFPQIASLINDGRATDFAAAIREELRR